ncbi:MAG: UPF0280 family protein [Armatimonadetes bacterium]|nr:UPF0280 family protein [Armatimonadota bacterium]
MEERREYVARTYRGLMQAPGLTAFTVVIEQTDLRILAERDLTQEATRAARIARRTVEAWIERHREFGTSLVPVDCPADAPRLIREMCEGARAAGVGPMAAVAGAIAQRVAEELASLSPNVIVENGGDAFLIGDQDRTVSIFAGSSPLSHRVGLVIPAARLPISVCTSSGTVGPSLSFGRADAAVIAARSASLADAVATATGNRVREPGDLAAAVEFAASIDGVDHAIAILGDQMAAWGDLRFIRL